MIRWFWTFAVFLVLTAIFGLPATVWSLVRPRSDITFRLGKLWSRLILAAAGIRPVYDGLDAAVSRLPCVYISNHQSLADVWSLILALPVTTRFVAKKSLFYIPIFGWALAASGFIPIDRKNRVLAIRSLAVAGERIRAGRPVVLFPEGTRSRDGRLAPFKRGAFHLAMEAGVPVVPVAISGSWVALPPRRYRIRPGEVLVAFAPSLDPARYGPEDVESLMADVRRAIAARLAPAELDPADALLVQGAR